MNKTLAHEAQNAQTVDERLGDDDEVEAAPVPDNDDLKKISTLAAQYIALEKEIADLEAQLAAKQAALKVVRELDLPTAMTEVGTTGFDLVGGGSVKLKTGYVAGISEKNRLAAHTWLENHGSGSLIKRTFTISFGKGEETWARKFERDMAQRKRPLQCERKDAVHTQTLGKFVREKIAAAKSNGISPEKEIPFDLFSIFELRYAEVEQPK